MSMSIDLIGIADRLKAERDRARQLVLDLLADIPTRDIAILIEDARINYHPESSTVDASFVVEAWLERVAPDVVTA